MEKCEHEFKDSGCVARICSSSNVCPAAIGKVKCDDFDEFSRKNPGSAALIVSHAETVNQFGG